MKIKTILINGKTLFDMEDVLSFIKLTSKDDISFRLNISSKEEFSIVNNNKRYITIDGVIYLVCSQYEIDSDRKKALLIFAINKNISDVYNAERAR